MSAHAEPMVPERHLTPDEKATTVRDWLSYRDTCRGPGGHGYPDPAIFPLTDTLNALPGVCTTQSCAGHRLTSTIDGAEYEQPGHLWLRLSTAVQEQAIRRAADLVAVPEVERVALLFQPWGDVFEVQFHGEECGTLDASVAAILHWFTALTEDRR